MKTMQIHNYAVILAGGKGERFWPLSTAARPKQFISLFGGRPLLTLALERLEGVVPLERTLIITSEDLIPATAEAARGLPAGNIVGEPCGRDTAAACALACGLVAARDPDGVVAILTADHLMADIETFRQTLRDSFTAAADGRNIVTIGIPPAFPATGFGYIEAGEALDTRTVTRFSRARRFVEKPDLSTATRYVESGQYCWNGGMFIWHVKTMRAALERFVPELLALVDATSDGGTGEELGARLSPVYAGLPKISVDYAVMERADNIVMAWGSFGWDDVGTWPAVAGHFAPDADGNVTIGACETLDAGGNVVVSEERLTALIGVRDLVVVHSGNATLICPRDRAQEVKQLVQRLARRPDGGKYL
ncbi:MAG: sugar phosphate nucleotidyltransferase [Kiritimatiellae bacterium]|nr:sugar phosphate nucleotidyltransferase [Kiritimatiellia bacterium]